jgi:hypothetical protein
MAPIFKTQKQIQMVTVAIVVLEIEITMWQNSETIDIIFLIVAVSTTKIPAPNKI